MVVDGFYTGLASFKGKLALITCGHSEHSIRVIREYSWLSLGIEFLFYHMKKYLVVLRFVRTYVI